jgi:hypothetical protein
MMESWQVILIIGLCSFPIVFTIVGAVLTYYLNKEEMTTDHEKRMQEEISQAIPYENLEEANNEIVSTNIKPAVIYGLYFTISIPIIVKIFGGIKYGPNLPYTVFLLAVGIPFLICFCHFLMKVEKRRCRILASDFDYRSKSQSIVEWIAIIPAIYLLLIMAMLKISNMLIEH